MMNIRWKYSYLSSKIIFLLFLLLHFINIIMGHGRLMEPPNRSSLWRLKEFEVYSPQKNYDDNQLWCGGMGSQYNLSGGKCGPCGDEYLKPRPRENENGGKYGRGIITRVYKRGQIIPIGVELTVNHLGYFVFSLCPIQLIQNGSMFKEEEECFDNYTLPLADGTGTKFLVKSNHTGYYKTLVKLPKDVTCKMCAIRWHYRTGNRWNYVNNETGALGIGDQEIFRGCSDVTIGNFPSDPIPTPSTTTTIRPILNTSRPPSSSSSPLQTTTPAQTTTTTTPVQTSSHSPLTNRPHQFPTNRPPVILPIAPTMVPSTQSTSSNKHPHPVMRPPPQSDKAKTVPIIIETLIDALPNNSLE